MRSQKQQPALKKYAYGKFEQEGSAGAKNVGGLEMPMESMWGAQ